MSAAAPLSTNNGTCWRVNSAEVRTIPNQMPWRACKRTCTNPIHAVSSHKLIVTRPMTDWTIRPRVTASSNSDGVRSGGPNTIIAKTSAHSGTANTARTYQPIEARTCTARCHSAIRPACPSTIRVISTVGSRSPSSVAAIRKASSGTSRSSVRCATVGIKAIAQPTGKNHTRNAVSWCVHIQRVTLAPSRRECSTRCVFVACKPQASIARP
jgi:hypothetical protein